MSLFSPDRRFLSEDLTRLEAVMGVQIVSVLASHVSQLASLSGVTPLPEPQSQPEEYVKKLISRWCDGLSSISPTWKHLLEVISGVGLPKLRAEIEVFMKGQLYFIHSSLLTCTTRNAQCMRKRVIVLVTLSVVDLEDGLFASKMHVFKLDDDLSPFNLNFGFKMLCHSSVP